MSEIIAKVVQNKTRFNAVDAEGNKVDGISGATITGTGLTTFLKSDLQKYEPYFAKVRSVNQIESL